MLCIRYCYANQSMHEVIIEHRKAVYELIGILEKSDLVSRIHVFHCSTGSELDFNNGLEVIPFEVRQANDEATLKLSGSKVVG